MVGLGARPLGPWPFADLGVSAEADNRHEVPREDDLNRLNGYTAGCPMSL